mgnify:CR=1 FL=1
MPPSQLWFGSKAGKAAHHALVDSAVSGAKSGAGRGFLSAANTINRYDPGTAFLAGEVGAIGKGDWGGALTLGAGTAAAQGALNNSITGLTDDLVCKNAPGSVNQKCHKAVYSSGVRTALDVTEDVAVVAMTGGAGGEAVAAEEGVGLAAEAGGAAEEGGLILENSAAEVEMGAAEAPKASRASKVEAWLKDAPRGIANFAAKGSLLDTALQLGLPYLLSSGHHKGQAPPEAKEAADRLVLLVMIAIVVVLLFMLV